MNPMLGELLGYAGNFFLGVCVMLGAAYVFQRSKRAALYVAAGGLCYVLAVPVEYFIGRMGYSMHLPPEVVHFVYALVNMGRHALLFGGLAMGMRTIAKETTT